jgi:hypothetical protein
MAVVRKVKLSSDIIKGESIIFDYPAGTNIDLIDPSELKHHIHILSKQLIQIIGRVYGLQLLIVQKIWC